MRFGIRVPPGGRPVTICTRGAAFAIGIVLRGTMRTRWVTRGRESRWTEPSGTVHFLPADDERHLFVLNSDIGCDLHALLIPADVFRATAGFEGHAATVEWKRLLTADDTVLRGCMTRLVGAGPPGTRLDDEGLEDVAGRLLGHLARLNGARRPDWRADTGVFDQGTMRHLVEYIDGHLRLPPSRDDVAATVGLSPAHFARKFRRSTGLSLQHFIHHRRVARSLERLQCDTDSLAGIALDLGFASQSHFTRLFRSLTGMTPAKFRKQVGGRCPPPQKK